MTATRKRKSGGARTHSSHVLVHPDQIWSMLEAAQAKKCSLSVVANLRSDEAHAGAQVSSVEYWNRKVLGIYFEKIKAAFLNIPHINIVTDASTHSQTETIVSICYSHELDSVGLCPCSATCFQMIAPMEFDLKPEIEILAATRKVERLSSYRFLAALSHQICFHRLLHLCQCTCLRWVRTRSGFSEATRSSSRMLILVRYVSKICQRRWRCQFSLSQLIRVV